MKLEEVFSVRVRARDRTEFRDLISGPGPVSVSVTGVILLLLWTSIALATDETPWIDFIYQPILTLDGGYQHFSKINSKHHDVHYLENSGMAHGSIYLAIDPTVSFELETYVTRTHRHPWAIDHFRETAKMVFWDDVAGDPIAITGGLSLYETPTVALHDPAFIHHAHFEAEAFVIVGKEWSAAPYWDLRIWALTAFGVGDMGSPWFRERLALQKNFCDQHIISFYLEGNVGFGNECLGIHHFKGYGPVNYGLFDGTLEYQYQVCDWGLLGLKGMYRFFARNAPKEAFQIILEWVQPFSL